MKRKICIALSCLLISGCSSDGGGILYTTAETIGVGTTADIALPPETDLSSAYEESMATVVTEEENLTDGTSEELTQGASEKTDEQSADSSDESQNQTDISEETTVAVTEETTTESIPETEAATTEKKRQAISITAAVGGTHYIGSSLTATDFTIEISYDDGSTVINPSGWAADPLLLSGENNTVTVSYADLETGNLVSTTIIVPAQAVPETQPPTQPAPVPVTGNIVETNTTLYTYDMMAEDLISLAAAYPDRLSVVVAGYTADSRAIYKAYFGNPGASKQIFICAATHAREYMTTQLVMRQLEYYCLNYDTGSYNGQTFRQIFEETCFVVVPMVNPDGVSISQLGEAGLRDPALRANLAVMYNRDVAEGTTSDGYDRYLVRWKANGRGVDLNRNFSPGWESVANKQPSTTLYKGEYAGSEAESQVLMNAINEMSNPLMAISYHSYGNLVYYQYGQSEPLYSANQALAQHINNLAGNGSYLAGYSNEAGFSNWCNLVKGIRSVTVETGTVPAPLSLDQLSLLWTQHQYTWVMLATVAA